MHVSEKSFQNFGPLTLNPEDNQGQTSIRREDISCCILPSVTAQLHQSSSVDLQFSPIAVDRYAPMIEMQPFCRNLAFVSPLPPVLMHVVVNLRCSLVAL